ncbi:MAG: hypothetical protein KDD92_17760 [Caldilineaceae bacterium]|nr:hypothetical protein [Caldilineaceae bacterium]
MSNACYRVYDLCLSLPFALNNELSAPVNASVDVHVRFGPTPHILPDLLHSYTYEDINIDVQVDSRGDLLLRTGAAYYYVTGGDSVIIDAEPDIALSKLRYMLMGYCIPALLNQRNALALHANALVTPRGAVVLSGSSGGGKSTLHAVLMARGMAMLSDDVTVLRTDRSGYQVLPGMRRYRLVADAWEKVQPPADKAILLNGPRNKVAVWAPANSVYNQPVPLAAIYILESHTDGEIVVEQLMGIEAFRLLQAQAYPPLESMILPRHLQAFSMLIDHTPVYRIRRPAHRWTADELADIVLSDDPSIYIPAAYG